MRVLRLGDLLAFLGATEVALTFAALFSHSWAWWTPQIVAVALLAMCAALLSRRE